MFALGQQGVDINNVFDAIALSEGKITEEAFQQGLEKGFVEAKEVGYHQGTHKGIEFGFEIGYYEGVVSTLLDSNERKKFEISEKLLLILRRLKSLLKSFSQENCPHDDVLDLKIEIKSQFRRLCSLLKFDGILLEKGVSF